MSQNPFPIHPDSHPDFPIYVDPIDKTEPANPTEPVDPITARNRANAQFSTGPKTEEGKAKSSQNARTHGCSSRVLNSGEYGEMLGIEQDLSDEIRPNGPTEQECVRMSASAMVRVRRCDRQLKALHDRNAEATRERQRKPLALRVERLANSVELWTGALDSSVEFGEALGPMYPAYLTNLKRDAEHEGDAGRIELFQALHAGALAIPRLMDLHRRFGHLAELPEGNGDAAEYGRRKESQEKSLAKLMKWIAGYLQGLIRTLAEARQALEAEDARPMDEADFIDESPEAKNIRRYRAEAMREYRRHLNDLEAYRTRNHREYERIVYKTRNKIEPTCRFGPFLIWMPLWVRNQAPADQIRSIIRELENDLPNNLRPTRDEARRDMETAERIRQEELKRFREKSPMPGSRPTGAAPGSPGVEPTPDPSQPPR